MNDGEKDTSTQVDEASTSSAGTNCEQDPHKSCVRGYGKITTVEEELAEDEEFQLVVENYFGLVSLLHNASHLGYFKMRGKISF